MTLDRAARRLTRIIEIINQSGEAYLRGPQDLITKSLDILHPANPRYPPPFYPPLSSIPLILDILHPRYPPISAISCEPARMLQSARCAASCRTACCTLPHGPTVMGRLRTTRIDSNRLGSTRIDSDRLGSTRIDSDRLGSTRIDSGRLGSTRIDSGRLGSTRLDSDRLGSTRVDSDRLGSTRIDSDRLGSTRIDSDRLGSTRIDSDRLGFVQLSWEGWQRGNKGGHLWACTSVRIQCTSAPVHQYTSTAVQQYSIQYMSTRVAVYEYQCSSTASSIRTRVPVQQNQCSSTPSSGTYAPLVRPASPAVPVQQRRHPLSPFVLVYQSFSPLIRPFIH
jgi:hypothetical protein